MKRATYYVDGQYAAAIISIHALVKRATEKSEKGRNKVGISIHALVKRATNILYLSDHHF